jgi:hypothetical protein
MNASRSPLPRAGSSSLRKVAFVLAGAIFALVPVHTFVSCQESGLIGFASMLLCGVAIIASLAAPDGTAGRLNPAVLAAVTCILNLLAIH